MARIRTIKPEFPQSESVGRLSRDARLLFVQLWTVCDDSGRCRAASRLLASLLYPYDDDAGGLIDAWMVELEREGCIRSYTVDGTKYLEICNWGKHQKIDRPSPSKLPEFARSREASLQDLGPRTLDLGPGTINTPLPPEGEATKSPKRFVPPTVDEVREYCRERNNSVDAQTYVDHYESKGWVVGKSPMRDWKASVRTWEKNNGNGTTDAQQRFRAVPAGVGGAAFRNNGTNRLADQLAKERERGEGPPASA